MPYAKRAEIESGALSGKGLELVWVDDPVDAFFLQIQGSGLVKLPSGKILRMGYAGKNGQPYFAIGRELVARGALKMENVSLQAIRAWLVANPTEAQAVMNKNPSYVFSRHRRRRPYWCSRRTFDGWSQHGCGPALYSPWRALMA